MASKKGGKEKKSTVTSDADLAHIVPETREVIKGRINEEEW